MSDYIFSILKSAPETLMSWGFEHPRPYCKDDMEGLRFTVHGFIFKGAVAVLYNEGADAFHVELQLPDGQVQQEFDDIYFDELVERIDRLVERTDNYEATVSTWLQSPSETESERQAKADGEIVQELHRLGFKGGIVIIG